ncbi:MAG: calcium-translocating P-type ATPase, PMCA-type [Bacillota bacterium]|nr:calcium-translocating P-type ATPase, PMCA-type [Bacillota bacterium]
MDWHMFSGIEASAKLKTDGIKGISRTEASKRLSEYGKNKLREKKKKSIFRMFLEQLTDFMVLILIAAALVSFFTAQSEHNGDYIDSIIIMVIVIINAITGVVQEERAEKAIEALKKLSSPKAKVIREGKEWHIASEEVVPGDIIVLSTGDYVCADARVIVANNLMSEEAALTGESEPVEKYAEYRGKSNDPLGDRKNMLFATGVITSGNGRAIVVETGMNTQVGKIATMISDEEAPKTPLQNKLAQTGKILGFGALAICAVIFVLGLINNVPPLEMFMISISLAVAAIPEGLAAVVTIVLAMGVRRMAQSRAIIRKLPAVETLGSASVICSDKTGTLTQNKMTVTSLMNYDGKVNSVSGEGCEILTLASLCNNAELNISKKDYYATGEPTEAAIISAAALCKKFKPELEKEFQRVKEFPFDSNRKRMTTVHKLKNGRFRVVTKGAPDILLSLCTSIKRASGLSAMSVTQRAKIENQNNQMAQNALRVLGVAYKDVANIPSSIEEAEKGLTFCGLIGMIDPPRPQAKQAVKDCKSAGIRPVMITGDHVITAKAIAKELGIFSGDDKAITGVELDKIPDEQLQKTIHDYSVFARVSPEHKVRIVKAFRSRGEVVAMTGDGINDAPALKAADIGCAMGLTGTDVAKGAADMIMTDDNFSTIVEAIRQGRGIFDNIKKTVHFLLSSNIGEILTVLTAFLLKLPTPLLAIQLLWVNLVTDSLPALALGVEPIDKDIMQRKPIHQNESLFANGMALSIAIEGCFIGAISFLAYTIGRVFFDVGPVPVVGRTMAFSVLAISQLVHAFNVRSEHSLFECGFFSNLKMIYAFVICLFLQVSVIMFPTVSKVFKTASLNTEQWLIVAGLSLLPLLITETEKLITWAYRRKKEREEMMQSRLQIQREI